MKINVSEAKGELNFGVFWVSLDGRLSYNWYQTRKLALKQYNYLKSLGRQPSIMAKINREDLK